MIERKKGEKQKSTPKMKASRIIPHLTLTPEKSQNSSQVLLVFKTGMGRALHTYVEANETRKRKRVGVSP